jgi:hypothetical protein
MTANEFIKEIDVILLKPYYCEVEGKNSNYKILKSSTHVQSVVKGS